MSRQLPTLTTSARALPESGIVKVFNYGRTRPGLIPLWAGEGDTPTPELISAAAVQGLAEGQTFYTYQRGIPALRTALAAYFGRLYGQHFSDEEFFVTCGGMQAIQMAVQLTVGDGDEVLVPSPAWPNISGAVLSRGGRVVPVGLSFVGDRWSLDLERLLDTVSDRTRAIFLNTPSNPTGWVASEAELRTILDVCRARGIWIIADEIYGRFHYRDDGTRDPDGGRLAPSLQTLREEGDAILFVQTFSKNWAMTGWRMGWLQAPPALGQTIENLIQYNTSGVPSFLQPAGVVALTEGEAIAREQVARASKGREIVLSALSGFQDVAVSRPDGAFYVYFRIDGQADDVATALRLVDEANIGLAPGSAFGADGRGFFRICYLRSEQQLHEAMMRLTGWLAKR